MSKDCERELVIIGDFDETLHISKSGKQVEIDWYYKGHEDFRLSLTLKEAKKLANYLLTQCEIIEEESWNG